MKKRLLVLFLCFVFTLTISIPITATEISESYVSDNYSFPANEITKPSVLGVIIGTEISTYYSAISTNESVATVLYPGNIQTIGTGSTEILIKNDNGEYITDTYLTVFKSPDPVSFKDVSLQDWFYPYVDYVSKFGLFNGVGENRFAPNDTMTRAMVVTVLYRIEGEPNTNISNPFSDVGSNTWYSNAVTWAYENNIVNGTSNTTFSPNDNVTREQFAAILYRYANFKHMDIENKSDISFFPDYLQTASYAQDAFSWAYSEKIINGKASSKGIFLAPKDPTTRAEVSKMLSKLITEKLDMGDAYSINFPKTEYTINVNNKIDIAYSIAPKSALKEVSWTSSDPTIATVNNGRVTGLKQGTTNITATLKNGESATCKITVANSMNRFDYAFDTLKEFIFSSTAFNHETNSYHCIVSDNHYIDQYEGFYSMEYWPSNDTIGITFILNDTGINTNVTMILSRNGSPYTIESNFYFYFYEIHGKSTIKANSFNLNSTMKYSSYNGDTTIKSDMLDLTESLTKYLVAYLDDVFSSNYLDISINDLGFTSFK